MTETTYKPRPEDDWIACTPGVCPVPPETVVEVRLRNGIVLEGEDAERAGLWDWGEDGPSTIAHYRIVKLAPSAGPVVVETVKRIEPGRYGIVTVNHDTPASPTLVAVSIEYGPFYTRAELLAAAETLRQIAEAMETQP